MLFLRRSLRLKLGNYYVPRKNVVGEYLSNTKYSKLVSLIFKPGGGNGQFFSFCFAFKLPLWKYFALENYQH